MIEPTAMPTPGASPVPPQPGRRRALAWGLAATLSACAPVHGPEREAAPTPVDPPEPPEPREEAPLPEGSYADPAGFRIPGEFEPQRAIWLGYDAPLSEVTAALVRTLAPQVPLRVLVPDTPAAGAAQRLLDGLGLPLPQVRIVVDRRAMFYLRDGAVFATGPARRLGVVDLRWNEYGTPAWCARRHATDPALARDCAGRTDTSRGVVDRRLAELTGAALLGSELFLEGGGIESNGQGLLIACEPLVRSRNPGRDRAALERLCRALPGVQRVIWLPEGLAQDPHLRGTIAGAYVAWGTGGHTDEFVRFADPHTVLLAWPDDAEVARHPVARLNRQRMARNAEVLARSRAMDGRPLRVLRVPMPRTVERRVTLRLDADRARSEAWTPDYFPLSARRRDGDVLTQIATTTYLNLVIAPGLVVLPDYVPHGTPAATQERVRQVVELAFPGRRVAFIDAMALNWLGGGLHCATLHEPEPA